MATSTGKAARKRYGTRFSAKKRRDSGVPKNRRARKVFGKLIYSVVAGNVPQAAVQANDALVHRIARERAGNGWESDANVAVPGPKRSTAYVPGPRRYDTRPFGLDEEYGA